MYRPCVKHRKIWFIWSVVEDNARAYILTSISILCVACGLYVDGLCDGPVSVFLSCLQRVDSSLKVILGTAVCFPQMESEFGYSISRKFKKLETELGIKI